MLVFITGFLANFVLGPMLSETLVAQVDQPTRVSQLKPENVAVIAAKGNAQSEALARAYMAARQIPDAALCLLTFENEEQISRDEWATQIRPQIRDWLSTHDPEGQITCLVTVRGVPLVIDSQTKIGGDAYEQFLQKERAVRERKTGEALASLRRIGAADTETATDERDTITGRSLTEWSMEFESVATDSQKRLQTLTGSEQANSAAQFERQVTLLAGGNLLQNSLAKQIEGGNKTEKVNAEFHFLRGRLNTLKESVSLVQQLPPSAEGDTVILAIIERFGGLIGTLGWIDEQLQIIQQNPTGSAFDSELALIKWDDENYRLYGPQPNLLRTSYRELGFCVNYPMMMTARIDAPTWDLCQKMFEAAIQVESEGGLKGKAYLDSRGIAPNAPDSSEKRHDNELLATAELINTKSKIEVVVNSSPALFGPGEAPSAALYCGGYSLGKYIDAFEWQTGAIGYHLSTIEALGLHDPTSTTWCGQMLQKGVAVTIGATDEAGLDALPQSPIFFGELISEGATVGEAYWASVTGTSWHMILLGDPLYRPFPQSPGN